MTGAESEVLIVMGVSGAGKTTLGKALARRLGLPFFDADDYHPQDNVEKMARGIPLDDSDRAPWLERLHSLIVERLGSRGAVLACSALKQSYRDRLADGDARVVFVYLDGSFDLILQRLQQRSGHFMKASLLRSQFEALEVTRGAILVDVQAPTEAQVERVVRELGRLRSKQKTQ